MRSLPILAALLATACPVAAEIPASPEGAARVEAAFRRILGPVPGVVTVTPAGASYDVALDASPLLSLIPMPGLTWTVQPYTISLTENGDGTWVVRESGPFLLEGSMPGVMDIRYSIDSITSEGLWDEGLMAYRSYRAELGRVSYTLKAVGPDQTVMNDDALEAEGAVFEITGGPSATGGGVDSTMTTTYTNYLQRMTLPGGPGLPASNLSIQALSYGGPVRFEGFRSAEIFDLVAFFVANPAPERITADQEALRGLLGSALPLFGLIAGELTMEGVAVDSPVGPILASSVGVEIEMKGAVADGFFREAITVAGLELPAGLVPAWAEPLVPSKGRIDVDVSEFDLAAPADILLRSFDLTKPEPVDQSVAFGLLGAFLPKGAVRVGLRPSNLAAPAASVRAEGELMAGPMGAPTGTMRVAATGLDAAVDSLRAAGGDPDAAQAAGMLGMAQALGKPDGNGDTVWEIEFTAAGGVLVNGTNVSGTGP